MIAIPDFAAGAMENWGLVTYRSAMLLYNESRTSLDDKQKIGYVVCHELAHQWFGNLVTMEWWTHLWLNEGFATWVGWLAVDHCYPEWKVWDQFVGSEFARALELDSLRSSHAIEVECKSSADVGQIFDAISYCKGSSAIRMLASVIGLDAMKQGLRTYLKQYAYSNALSGHLWEHLGEASKQDVASLMAPWTQCVGFPVVSLSLGEDGDTVVATQQRFLATGPDSTDGSSWPIPLAAIGAKDAAIGATFISDESIATGVSLKAAGGFVKANAGVNGIFRVGYDDALIAALCTPGADGAPAPVSTLDPKDRMGLVSDARCSFF
jgi:aminopeptidase N